MQAELMRRDVSATPWMRAAGFVRCVRLTGGPGLAARGEGGARTRRRIAGACRCRRPSAGRIDLITPGRLAGIMRGDCHSPPGEFFRSRFFCRSRHRPRRAADDSIRSNFYFLVSHGVP